MTENQTFDFEAYVVAVTFLGGRAAFALGDGTVRFADSEEPVRVHAGSVLAAVPSFDGKSLVTGGDDGRIARVGADGSVETLAEKPRKWIDIIATGPNGAVAFASGRTAWVRLSDGSERGLELKRGIGGLAFAPKGMRVAVAHVDGVTLWWPNTDGAPQTLDWKGAHLGVTFSPDGKFVMTTMQEPQLHGWRLADKDNIRMAGYPSKVKSWSWSAKGRFLATSGAGAAIMWPFHISGGPAGKAPLQIAPKEMLVTAVACHPKKDIVAVGYEDGSVVLARFDDDEQIEVVAPGGSPITTIAFDGKGERFAFGTDAGKAGLVAVAL
ncbi:MAG: hypothetical protein C0606_03315 [Hyphomicrobiales bacterium]|nr:MAG: hypothetical protein C0606_03315 [Hyphomicrobiales bacterium]